MSSTIQNIFLFVVVSLINCWSSVVASVVLPQLCNLHCPFFGIHLSYLEVRFYFQFLDGSSKAKTDQKLA